MRIRRVSWVGSVLLGLGLCHCGDSSECPAGFECIPLGGGGSGGSAGDGAAGATGEGGGGGGVVPSECNPTEGQPIGADCGVFVKAGSSGDGTQANPFGTIADATTNLGSATRIYVCGGDTFAGSIDLTGGVSLFGGLSCESWQYSEASSHPRILGDENEPALSIKGPGTSRLRSVDVEAPDATDDGASSIAVLISQTTVSADQAEFLAHDGHAGALPPAPEDQADQANGGMMGASAGSPLGNAGGGSNTCEGVNLLGGQGGSGGATMNGFGGQGNPGDFPLPGGGGVNGAGQGAGGLDCSPGVGGGGLGGAGDDGSSGAGADSVGSLGSAGYAPSDGHPGMPGTYGHSGGGGGGSRADTDTNGAGGGGGGAGGCGGHGGAAGKGGGSSFALVSIDASVTLDATVTLTAGAGGDGGAGVAGQLGQAGGGLGLPGNPGGGVNAGCAGGPGGDGGHGGNGGGGHGGYAVAIAYHGPMPTGGTPDMSNAMPGGGGDGGDNGQTPAGGTGDAGEALASMAF